MRGRLIEFTELYGQAPLSKDEREALGALIMASADDHIATVGRLPSCWPRICDIFSNDRQTHQETLEYWACLDTEEADEWFHVTPHVRRILDGVRERCDQ